MDDWQYRLRRCIQLGGECLLQPKKKLKKYFIFGNFALTPQTSGPPYTITTDRHYLAGSCLGSIAYPIRKATYSGYGPSLSTMCTALLTRDTSSAMEVDRSCVARLLTDEHDLLRNHAHVSAKQSREEREVPASIIILADTPPSLPSHRHCPRTDNEVANVSLSKVPPRTPLTASTFVPSNASEST
jgi:hypothetical protein